MNNMKRKILSAITPILTKWLSPIALLCAGCSVHETSQTTSKDILHTEVVQNVGEPRQNTISKKEVNEHMHSMAYIESIVNNPESNKNCEEIERELSKSMPSIAYVASIIRDVLFPENDPLIERKKISENPILDGSEVSALIDNNEGYTFVFFNEFPMEGSYGLYYRRVVQQNPNIFLPCDYVKATLNSICSQNINETYGINLPYGILVSSKGYLPGEQVTWRIISADGLRTKDVSFVPKPMILKDRLGKTILKAALLSINNPTTTYFVHVPASEDLVEVIATAGKEVRKKILPVGLSENFIYVPLPIEATGGVDYVEIRFLKDGSSYKMEFPWGSALSDYIEGRK